MSLKINNLSKSFGETQAVKNVSFELPQGAILALLGPSGCGKSTLLNLIAGLETADSGKVFWKGKDLADVPVSKRNFGLMFQDFALFPHKNVFQNLAFGLKMQDKPKQEIADVVKKVLELVGLPSFADREVNSLSGGEQQRVALARSLAPKPALLMLDEPLGSLDRALRQKLLEDLREILRERKQTTLFVTHDQEEAFSLADKVAIMNQGGVAQIGSPMEIYLKPATIFVANFIGLNNILDGEVKDGKIETILGNFERKTQRIGKVKVLLRPNRVVIGDSLAFKFSAKLIDKSFRGEKIWAMIETSEQKLSLSFNSQIELPEIGERIQLSLNPDEALQII